MAISYELQLRLDSAIRTREEIVEIVEILNNAKALSPAAEVVPLEMTANATYGQQQLQDVADKVDAIIAALKAAGLME